MHLYIITRGIKYAVDRFITELQGKYLPFTFKAPKDKEKKKYMVQVAVRPIQLWEVVFPKEHKELMFNTVLQPGKQHMGKWEKYCKIFRKVLGLEKIPEFKKGNYMPLTKDNMGIYGIGIKEDNHNEDGCEML